MSEKHTSEKKHFLIVNDKCHGTISDKEGGFIGPILGLAKKFLGFGVEGGVEGGEEGKGVYPGGHTSCYAKSGEGVYNKSGGNPALLALGAPVIGALASNLFGKIFGKGAIPADTKIEIMNKEGKRADISHIIPLYNKKHSPYEFGKISEKNTELLKKHGVGVYSGKGTKAASVGKKKVGKLNLDEMEIYSHTFH